MTIAALCLIGILSGNLTCFEVAFSAPDYIDCTDRPSPALGSNAERGGGMVTWGNIVAGEFVPEGRAVYEWSGRQDQGGGVIYALVGVDEDRIWGDGMDRTCVTGRFNP